MCKASVYADRQEGAREGQVLAVGISAHNLGAFHRPGEAVGECVVCVQNGTIVTFSRIPAGLREQYGLDETETGTFIDTGANQHDLVDFGKGESIPLVSFADQGIEVRVGAREAKKAIARAAAPELEPA